MRNQKKRRSGYRRSSDWQRYLRILALPLVVVILILVIVLTDRGANTDGGPTEEVQQSQTNAGDGTEISAEGTEEQPGAEMDGTGETGEGETAEIETAEGETGSGEADPAAADGSAEDAAEDGQDGLRRSDIPEITALMEEYCAAKVSCDAEAMYRIYGRTDMTGVEELEQRMQWRARYVEDIENVDCYILPGMEDNSYVTYVTADIKFRVTETLAPTIMWCYVRQEDDGTWHIVENVTAEEAEYAAKAEQSESVRRLAAEVNEKLEVAVASDSRLASAYGMLRDGTTVPDNLQTTAAATTAAETAAAETTAQ